MAEFALSNDIYVNEMESPMQKLLDQLEDFNVKYDALEHNYNTIKLENDEYKNHISDLQQQNKDLKSQIKLYQSELEEEDYLKPMMNYHITSMRSSLAINDNELQELSHKCHQYSRSIQSLQSENTDMKKQNKKLEIKFRNVLATNTKQKQSSKLILTENNQQIEALQSEIQSLRDELDTIKTLQLCPSLSPSPSPIHVETPTSQITKIQFQRSIDAFPNMTAFPLYNPSVDGIDSMNPIINKYNRSLSFLREESDSMDIDKIKLKLEALESENKKLMQQLNVYNNEEDDEKDQEKYEEKYQQKDVMEEFDDNDINEMEQLFHKCMLQYWKNVNFDIKMV